MWCYVIPSELMLLVPELLMPFSKEPHPPDNVDKLSGGVGAGRLFFRIGVDLPIDFYKKISKYQ